jgi:hypothetical protein
VDGSCLEQADVGAIKTIPFLLYRTAMEKVYYVFATRMVIGLENLN